MFLNVRFLALGLCGSAGIFLASCDWGAQGCTLEGSVSCVMINDSTYIDPRYGVFLSHAGTIEKISGSDSRACFVPRTGTLTFFVTEGDSLVAQKQVTVKRSADGCGTDFPPVNFDLPE